MPVVSLGPPDTVGEAVGEAIGDAELGAVCDHRCSRSRRRSRRRWPAFVIVTASQASRRGRRRRGRRRRPALATEDLAEPRLRLVDLSA